MAGADEVETCIFHQLHLADFGGIEGHGAEHSVIAVDAGAVYVDRLAVEQEALCSIERDGTYAELFDDGGVRIICEVFQRYAAIVEMRIAERPEFGPVDVEDDFHCLFFTRSISGSVRGGFPVSSVFSSSQE